MSLEWTEFILNDSVHFEWLGSHNKVLRYVTKVDKILNGSDPTTKFQYISLEWVKFILSGLDTATKF